MTIEEFQKAIDMGIPLKWSLSSLNFDAAPKYVHQIAFDWFTRGILYLDYSQFNADLIDQFLKE